LPNFSVLDDVGLPEEVLVTHAHTDHTGALPVLVASLPPDVKIRMTPASKAITQVLMSDAVKLMAQRGENDGELPLYPAEAADAALARIVDVPWVATVPICDGALTATWVPAGHILGASSIFIEGKSESLLMTGDVSVANQLTIPGMIVPQCRPDVMVMESTYGNRQHADRSQQEAALAMRVAEVIERGGKVLIPGFAVGRAQEVILILAQAMRRGDIPTFPVFVDGMVRSVNAVYASFIDELSPSLRRKMDKGEAVFYAEHVRSVDKSSDRTRVLSGPPCCIVASSGMLIGGASSYYAERLAGDPDNLIAITGYQDEESPGRALLDLMQNKEGQDRTLILNGERVSVACRVEPYSLSAHADSGELTGLVQRLKPRTCFLVHGDEDARKSLAVALDAHLPDGVRLPVNGGSYLVEVAAARARKGYGRRVDRSGIGGGRALNEGTLEEVRAYVIETEIKGPFRVQELAEMWFGSLATTLSEVEAFRLLLREGRRYFEPDRRRPFLFHVTETLSVDDGPIEMNEARTRIQNAFPAEAGLFRCSAFVDEGVYELAFHFPDVIPEQYGDLIRQLEEETRWALRLRETPHQARLFEVAQSAVPKGATSLKAPALRLDQREVVVVVAVGKDADDWAQLKKKAEEGFRSKTGYQLVLERPDEKVTAAPAQKSKGAWEINRAYQEIRKVFLNEKHVPSKIGLKGGSFIELVFISPQVGGRYQDLINALGERIGWEVRVRPSSNQELISQKAREVTPEEWVLRGSPKIYPDRVVVPVVHLPGDEDRIRVAAQFSDLTGYVIDWEGAKG